MLRTMLNSNYETRLPCLVLNLSRNAFNCSPLNMSLAVGLSYTALTMMHYILSTLNLLKVFIMDILIHTHDIFTLFIKFYYFQF